MKFRYKYALYLCAAAALACSCSDDDDNAPVVTGSVAGHEMTVTVTAATPTLESDLGKAAFTSVWAEGDQLSVSYWNNVYQNNVLTLSGNAGQQKGTFVCDNALTEEKQTLFVHYPYSTTAATICKQDISEQKGTAEGLHEVDCMSGTATVNNNAATVELTRDVALIHLCDLTFAESAEATTITGMTLTGSNVGVNRQWSATTGESVACDNGTITVNGPIALDGNSISDLYFAIFPETSTAGDSFKLSVALDDGAIYNVVWTIDTPYEANKEYQIVPTVKNSYNLYPYKKAYKLQIPSLADFEKSWIHTAYDGDLKVAEICLEYLKTDLYATRAIVVYPVGVLDYGAADYTKGFVAQHLDYDSNFNMSVGNVANAGGLLSFDYDAWTATYTVGTSTPVSTVYLNKFGVTGEPIEGATELTTEPYLLTDLDGNEYGVMKLGIDVWMQRSLRTTKLADGTDITIGTSTSPSDSDRLLAFYQNHDETTVEQYGLLYGVGSLDNLAVIDPDSRNTWAITTYVQSNYPATYGYDTDWSHMMRYNGYSINRCADPAVTTWNGISGQDNITGLTLEPSGYMKYSSKKFSMVYGGIVGYYWVKFIDSNSYGQIVFCNSWSCKDFPATSYSSSLIRYYPVRMVRTDKHGE